MAILAAANLTGKANAIAEICFVAGLVLVFAGAVIGLGISRKEAQTAAPEAVQKKLEDTKTKVKQLTATAKEAAEADGKDTVQAAKAGSDGAAAESGIKDLEGLITALPQGLRFSGFLVLLGALLMSVATVQFGGHSIF